MLLATTNLKGGVGKSTLAVHFAAWLMQQGHSVAIIDADRQGSACTWTQAAIPDIPTFLMGDEETFLGEAKRIAREYEYVIADSPATLAELSRFVLFVADIAIVPFCPSDLDLKSTQTAAAFIRQVQEARNGYPKALVIGNKIQPHTVLSRELLTLPDVAGIPLAKNHVKLRQVYADAPGQKTTVFAMGSRGREASNELTLLFEEVLNAA
jgi:chromosome partitioning protein